MNAPYHRLPVKAPRLSGMALRIVCGLLETPGIGRLIANQSLRDLGLPALLNASVPDANPQRPHLLEAASSGVTTNADQATEFFAGHVSRPLPTSADYTRGYAAGSLSPIQVAEASIAQTKSSNEATPALRAIIGQNHADLLKQGEASADRWARGVPLSPLDGVPVAVKDEVDMLAYGTTVGTSYLGKEPATSDATAVARLRAAGALLIGKANMHELGIGVTGINPHHGAARNPYNPGHATGGSSSGSASAVVAGLCPLALGADGGGSIRIPASLCGIYGLKPTFGRISEHGAAPLCWSVAHLGPMASNPADLALGLAIMAGNDPLDPMTHNRPTCDLSAASASDVTGMRIGVYTPWFDDADEAVVARCKAGLDRLVAAGAELVEVKVYDPNLTRLAHMVTIVSEMLAGQGPALVDHRQDYGLDVRMNFRLATFLSGREYVHAQRLRNDVAKQTQALFEDIDLLATPTTARTAPPIRAGAEARGESDLVVLDALMRYAVLANLTGLPAISCPVGYDPSGLPIGLQLMGRPFAEGALLRSAKVLDTTMSMQRGSHWFCPHPDF